MPHYLVEYRDIGTAEQREAHRTAHIGYRKGLGDAMLLAGPILDDDGSAIGSLIIIAADNPTIATEQAGNDPFVAAGVLELVSVRAYRIAAIKPPSGGQQN